jgi:hypothetical protein
MIGNYIQQKSKQACYSGFLVQKGRKRLFGLSCGKKNLIIHENLLLFNFSSKGHDFQFQQVI